MTVIIGPACKTVNYTMFGIFQRRVLPATHPYEYSTTVVLLPT